MKRISNLIVFLLWSVLIWAGQEVTGRVVDNTTRQPIDYANVTVLQPGQTVPVGGTVTDATGHFSIELSQGAYEIIVSFMGYTEERIAIQVNDKEVALGRILLKEDTQTLEEVEVVAQHSAMRFELDRKVFIVNQDIASAGASVTDVLENIPSVEVDQQGTISLRNSEDVEIWINGKPAGLNADNRGQVLQQMPAGSIDKIEVITNPSAKFSPEGSAGIINLVMKQDRKAGYYGSVQA
ncbi:MAG: carboxypeptidase-like regulatory domain-containing protein, partial [Paludibacteraceae bacterium]|nr:carboxypeptidase-like regulatory domain-containing protein [Paludibacteraceae bacterium]